MALNAPRNQSGTVVCPYTLSERESRRLFFYLLLGTIALLVVYVSQQASFESTFGACAITLAALLPSYLWVRRKVQGLPILPLYALTFIGAYAAPLIYEHPVAILYTPTEHLLAGAKVTAFLVLLVITWFISSGSQARVPKKYRAFTPSQAVRIFFFVLLVAIVYRIVIANGLVWRIPGSVNSVLRVFILGLNLVGSFYLFYAAGKKMLTRFQLMSLFVLFGTYLLATIISLLLIHAIGALALAIIGYTLAAKKVPWKTVIAGFLVLSFLHAGKHQMRTVHWWSSQADGVTQPWEYPARLIEWSMYSLNAYTSEHDPLEMYVASGSEKSPSSLLERTSLVHLFLLVQKGLDSDLPLLLGKTYSYLPYQLVPRIILPTKVNTLQGTRTLNIHYGLQSARSSKTTSIGWGLLNEAYANFGLVGIVALAFFLGFFLAKVTSWVSYAPVLSARAMFGVIVMALCLQNELSAGTYFATLFQTVIALWVVAMLFMREHSRFEEGEFHL